MPFFDLELQQDSAVFAYCSGECGGPDEAVVDRVNLLELIDNRAAIQSLDMQLLRNPRQREEALGWATQMRKIAAVAADHAEMIEEKVAFARKHHEK